MELRKSAYIVLFVSVLLGVLSACNKNDIKPFNPNNPDAPTGGITPYEFVFKNNREGYVCYRVPAILQAPNKDILVFIEARKNSCADGGNLDVGMKRSTDGGETWSDLQILVDRGEERAGNIATVVDYLDPNHPEGRIFLIYHTSTGYRDKNNKANRIHEIWYKTSVDNGHTWSKEVNISTSVHRPMAPDYDPSYNFPEDWRANVIGPAAGLQIKNGPNKGRLYVAAHHSVGSTAVPFSNQYSHGFYSDDHGKTWKVSLPIEMPCLDESTAAQLPDGSILQNSRYNLQSDFSNQPIETKYRVLCLSKDGGHTWEKPAFNHELPSPVCQGDMIDVEYKGKHYLLFSHPDSQELRVNMTIFASGDDGKTWPYKLKIDKGPGAYSAIVQLDEETIGLIYEYGNTGGILFAKVKLGDIIK